MRADHKSFLYVVAAEIVIISLEIDEIMDHGGLDVTHRFSVIMMMVSQWILIAAIYELGMGRRRETNETQYRA